MKKVLVIHQSAELYGSDRSMLELLSAWRSTEFEFIVCVPEEGPLVPELRLLGIRVEVMPLVKVGRAMFTVPGILMLPLSIISAIRRLNRVTRGERIDIVYTNTLAVLAGAFWAAFYAKPHVWHVREIIQRPKFVSYGFQKLVRHFSTLAICNSQRTADWIGVGQEDRVEVVWNGVSPAAGDGPVDVTKSALGFPENLPLVLLVGRINTWKGQDLLIEALNLLEERGQNRCQVAIIGGPPPGQSHLMDQLESLVAHSAAAERIRIIPFTDEVEAYYSVADILVVPSREPEPFGRVAIEGMAYGLPVIAAAHGGLVEIVEDGITGLLFEPNSAASLADQLERLLGCDDARREMGVQARRRQKEMFSLDAYQAKVYGLLREVEL